MSKESYTGKVREVKDNGDGTLSLIASDRVSAFDQHEPMQRLLPFTGRVVSHLDCGVRPRR
eukprot:m.215210 g.215210  ORF g.215210 m.215210 type:complete len:61 (-) comp18632_c0_seq1:1366-1548(-)